MSWTFLHRGGGPLTSVNVYYTSSVDSTRQYFFMDPQAAVGTGEREDSIPLPEAGLTYFFTVTASNDQGSSGDNCPPITLDIGGFINISVFLCCGCCSVHYVGIPARPDPPKVDTTTQGVIFITFHTPHSGVRGNYSDQLQFILLVKRSNIPVASLCFFGLLVDKKYE